jgi:hypothetical protein
MKENVIVKFADLFPGDRFVIPGCIDGGRIWPKIDFSSAREHTLKEISMKEKGFGHLDSKIVSFVNTQVVCFIPV